MAVSDPVADALTKIRNASRVHHATVEVRSSRLVVRICEVLKQEGFIRSYKALGDTPASRVVRVYLKYALSAAQGGAKGASQVKNTPAISEIIRVSKPGRRICRGASQLPRVLRGLGIAVVTTSKGVMTEREAYRQRIGGEVLCYVW